MAATLSDAEVVDLTRSHGGQPESGWWDRVCPHSLGWVTARTEDDELVGFVNVAWDGGDHAFLIDTKTRPSHQRQGLGVAVVGRAIAEAQAAGCEWLFVDYGENITIGPRTFVNYHLTALDVAVITIGADCQIGPNVQLLTPTHPVEPGPRRDRLEAARPITIGDNVWLGGGVIVLPGVTIGANTVVGAGAVVTRDLPANVVAVGNPARVVRRLDPES